MSKVNQYTDANCSCMLCVCVCVYACVCVLHLVKNVALYLVLSCLLPHALCTLSLEENLKPTLASRPAPTPKVLKCAAGLATASLKGV